MPRKSTPKSIGAKAKEPLQKVTARNVVLVKKSAAKKKPVRKAPARKRLVGAKAIVRALRVAASERELMKARQLERHEGNPIIEPREHLYWEMKATFNPGAVYADGRVHLLYRAIGSGDVSVLGYAASDDGLTMTERSDEPVYVPPSALSISDPVADDSFVPLKKTVAVPYPGPQYCSGGGWNGGCEDPRLTLIDKTVYLTYTAFDGWGSIRMALSSIPIDAFLRHEWCWKKPALISQPGQIHKNWVLFPEKINGKYAVLHGITPDVMVEYLDSLDFDGSTFIKSERPSGDKVQLRKGVWDSRLRGAGPPPIKTRLGWLLFYHAVDMREPSRYKIGAMVLDINDPTKILFRSKGPVLAPDANYENEGLKSGIVYSCGAVVMDGELFVYYGGSDTVSCVAMAKLDTFLDELAKDGTPKFELKPEPKLKLNPKPIKESTL